MKQSKTLFITQTAVLIAALIAVQFVTKSLGTWVTGSLVNFILILSTMIVGISGGLMVAFLSPFFAFFFGIGIPIIQLVPCIAVGNIALVLTYGLLMKHLPDQIHSIVKWIISIPSAAIIKFFVLYILVVKLALSLIPNLPQQKVAVLSTTFGVPQLFTALIGGALAFIIVPLVKKSMK